MSAPRCDACRHWKAAGPWARDFLGGVGACHAIPHTDDLKEPEFANALACVQDSEDYNATLYTRPDFFCAMFELKIAKPDSPV